MSLLPGTAQRVCGGAKRAAQRERGQPGGAEQVVQRLRAPAGPPEPEAKDQACDEIERRKQCLETGKAYRSSCALHTTFLFCFFNLAEQHVSLSAPLSSPFPAGCVSRRYQSYSPW